MVGMNERAPDFELLQRFARHGEQWAFDARSAEDLGVKPPLSWEPTASWSG